jgi:transposase
MKKMFIGIDVSKDVFDVCSLDEFGDITASKEVFANTKKGIADFCKSLNRWRDHDIWICLEHTGHYGYLLASEFSEKNLKYSLINPLEIKNSIGMTRGKNDAIDAYRIAYYAFTHVRKLKQHIIPIKDLQKLKALMGMRDGYVKINVQLKNSFKALEIIHQSINIKQQLNDHQLLIKRQEKSIDKVEKQIMEIINNNEELKKNFNKVTSVIGVGMLTAVKCIIETDNFIKFKDGRKFSCHCGLAPFEYQSGSSVRGRTKTSSLSNKGLKSILFKAASTAIQHDPQLKNYYSRKLADGKHKLSVLNAVANKIVLRIFAVANRNEPFVKLVA